MNKQFLLLLLLFSGRVFAQQECNCRKNFDEMYQKIRDNYAGWTIKVNPGNQAAFDALSQKVREKSLTSTDPKTCYKILKEWTDFFQDGHLFINTQVQIEENEPQELVLARAAKIPVQKYTTELLFLNYLNTNTGKLNEVEGIWESDDQSYRLGIVKDEKTAGKFNGFLLSKRDNMWVAGKTKFELFELSPGRFRSVYYYADFTGEATFSKLVKNILVMDGIYKFAKIHPVPAVPVSDDDLMHRIPDYRVEKLDSNNTLIVLPPFTLPNAEQYVSELVTRNAALITSSKNLIIDLRNNPGGDENAFTPLFPYIAQGAITRKGGKFRASQENLILLTHELKSIQAYPQFRETLEPKLRTVVRKIESNMGQMVDGPDKTFSFPQNQNNPQKVVILVNKNTASTAESVSLESKQSTKTIIMGQNTKGLADYIEVRDLGMPCFGWRLAFALALSSRLPGQPIDNIGLKPDVIIPDNEYDWVEYTRKYLNNIK